MLVGLSLDLVTKGLFIAFHINKRRYFVEGVSNDGAVKLNTVGEAVQMGDTD